MEFRLRGFAEIQGAVFQFQLCLSDNEVPLWSRAEREPSHLLACLEYPVPPVLLEEAISALVQARGRGVPFVVGFLIFFFMVFLAIYSNSNGPC